MISNTVYKVFALNGFDKVVFTTFICEKSMVKDVVGTLKKAEDAVRIYVTDEFTGEVYDSLSYNIR